MFASDGEFDRSRIDLFGGGIGQVSKTENAVFYAIAASKPESARFAVSSHGLGVFELAVHGGGIAFRHFKRPHVAEFLGFRFFTDDGHFEIRVFQGFSNGIAEFVRLAHRNERNGRYVPGFSGFRPFEPKFGTGVRISDARDELSCRGRQSVRASCRFDIGCDGFEPVFRSEDIGDGKRERGIDGFRRRRPRIGGRTGNGRYVHMRERVFSRHRGVRNVVIRIPHGRFWNGRTGEILSLSKSQVGGNPKRYGKKRRESKTGYPLFRIFGNGHIRRYGNFLVPFGGERWGNALGVDVSIRFEQDFFQLLRCELLCHGIDDGTGFERVRVGILRDESEFFHGFGDFSGRIGEK